MNSLQVLFGLGNLGIVIITLIVAYKVMPLLAYLQFGFMVVTAVTKAIADEQNIQGK